MRYSSILLAITATQMPIGILRADQAPPVSERRLERPEARWAEPFSLVAGVRELTDRRVMVSDGIEETVQILDLAAGRAIAVGRPGAGPGEYQGPDALFPLPGGATLLVDLGNGRLSVYGADGRFRTSTPIAQGSPDGGPGSLRIVMPRAVDAEGRVYFQPPGRPGADGPVPDSAAILRYDMPASRFDTVAFVKVAPPVVRTTGTASNQNVRAMPRPYPVQDGWAVAPDGRLAIVRGAGYRLEWVTPAGRVAGPPVTFRAVPIRPADREEWATTLASGLAMSMENRNGEISTSFSRGRPGQQPADLTGVEFPSEKPAFPSSGVLATPEGEVWVERHVPAGQAREYDTFDARGIRTGRVILQPRSRVVAFGAGAVYVVRLDEDDLQHLERYRR
jgi:hypothetical protein